MCSTAYVAVVQHVPFPSPQGRWVFAYPTVNFPPQGHALLSRARKKTHVLGGRLLQFHAKKVCLFFDNLVTLGLSMITCALVSHRIVRPFFLTHEELYVFRVVLRHRNVYDFLFERVVDYERSPFGRFAILPFFSILPVFHPFTRF